MTPGRYPLWLDAQPLVLASGSLTRRDMLQAAGIPVEVHRPGLDERAAESATVAGRSEVSGMVAGAVVAAGLAAAKAATVSRLCPGRLVLAADQTLALDGRLFHKPENVAEAIAHLSELSARTHSLHSAAVLMRDGTVLASHVVAAELTMRRLSPRFIEDYVTATLSDILSSVGGYQIEGAGAQLFARIEGDHFTILGLPLLPVLASLRDLGVLAR